MAWEKVNLLATFNGNEYPGEVSVINRNDRAYRFKEFCEEAVRKSGLTTPRKNPKYVTVELFVLEIQKGQLVRKPAGKHDIKIPLERMTSDDYAEAMDELVAELPEEFQAYVRSVAWDRGHASGLENVLSIAQDLVDDLTPVVAKYTKRILNK